MRCRGAARGPVADGPRAELFLDPGGGVFPEAEVEASIAERVRKMRSR